VETKKILANHSYQELLSLLDWFYYHGPIPIVIGGWAVFFYNSYMGSADIDLVGPSMGGLFDNTIEGFERSQGYEAISTDPLGLETSFRKPIMENGVIIGHVMIDACTYERDSGRFHEDPGKKLPFALCDDQKLLSQVELDARRQMYIPKKSLLLLYKLKAFRDRQYDLRTKGPILSSQKRIWLNDKWVKDGADLIALLDPQPRSWIVDERLDVDLFHGVVEEYSLEFALDSLRALSDLNRSLELYINAEREEVSDWVKNILNKKF